MKNLILISLLCVMPYSMAQTIFNETFTNTNGTTSGTDDIGGVTWTATCPYCDVTSTADYLKVLSNQLETQDSNGPAYWTTGDIDISSCNEGVIISMDMSESGTLEGIAASCAGGCNTLDVVKFEVSYDSGASWVAFSDAVNGTTSTGALACDCGTCGSPSSSYPVPWCGDTLFGPAIMVDDFTSTTFSDCGSVGISNTIALRVTTMCWAGSENIMIDNVQVACSSCALPVELLDFSGVRTEESSILSWTTATETDNKKFDIQRSSDGFTFYTIGSVKGANNSISKINYSFTDKNPLNEPISYYRLKQIDLNLKYEYSNVISLDYEPHNIFYNGVEIEINFQEVPNQKYTLNVYDVLGKIVHTGPVVSQDKLAWDIPGVYMLEIPELLIKKKLVIQ